MTDINEITIQALTTAAATVGADHAAYSAAVAAEREAAAALMDRVVAAIKPSLRALSSRIRTRHDTTSGNNGCNPQEIQEFAPERGLLVVDERSRDRGASGNRGSYSGYRVYLLADGRWAIGTIGGSWSAWQGDWDRESMILEIASTAEAVAGEEVADMVGAIQKALASHTALAAHAKAAKERAARISALASLI